MEQMLLAQAAIATLAPFWPGMPSRHSCRGQSLMNILSKREPTPATDAELPKAIRAHGNASEYIPLFVTSFVFLCAAPPSTFLVAIALLATVSRILHAAGMLRLARVGQRNSLRFYGAWARTSACLRSALPYSFVLFSACKMTPNPSLHTDALRLAAPARAGELNRVIQAVIAGIR